MRVVLDTNVVVSALVFHTGHSRWLRDAWKSGVLCPLVNAACADELIRVLAYPRFKLSESDIAELLGDYLPWTTVIETKAVPGTDLPPCRDPEDQKFMELAAATDADALVTGDAALLELAALVAFQILAPSELRGQLG